MHLMHSMRLHPDRPRQSMGTPVTKMTIDQPVSTTPWYQSLASLEASLPVKDASGSTVSVQLVDKLRSEGASVMEGEVAKYKREQNLSKADSEWMKMVLKKGTVSDRCSALTLAFQASPLHGLEHFKGLMGMAKSKSRNEALMALEAIKDLFGGQEGSIMPPGRRLRYLHQQPVSCITECSPETRRQAALFWYFEESLKGCYLEVIKVIEILTQDPILHARERGCRLAYQLLLANPHEQDTNILALLANKLGDSERRLSSRIPYYFAQLANTHSNLLTATAIEYIRQVIERPGVTDRTKYYALTFLVEVRLARGAPLVTAAILQVYLGLFKQYIVAGMAAAGDKKNFNSKRQKRLRHRQKRRGEVASAAEQPAVPEEHARMAKMLLTGINRAFPFASNAGEELKQLLLGFATPLLGLCTPRVAFPTTIQALNLLLTLAPHDLALRQSVLSSIQGLLDQQDRLRLASASHPLMIRVLGRSLNLLIEANDRQGIEALLKSLLRFCLAIISPAFVVAALVLFEAALARLPGLKGMLNVVPENLEVAKKSSAFELVALTRHYHPRIRRYATALLASGKTASNSATDKEVNAAPFEKISFALFLSVWNRMRRVRYGKSSASRKKSVDSDDSDDDFEIRMAEGVFSKSTEKKTDNAQVTAALYAQDEYAFVSTFAGEKDRRLAAEEAKKQAKRAKKQKESHVESGLDSSSDIEAEADAIMEKAIRGMIGDEDVDDDFMGSDDDIEEEDASEINDEEVGEDVDDDASEVEYEVGEEEDSNGEEIEDVEDDFSDVSHDSDDINLFLKDSDDEEAIEEYVEKAEPGVEVVKKNKIDRSKLYKGVFATASDYEDALQD